MTTAEQFDPGREEPVYLRVVQDGERAPVLDISADGHLFARTLPDSFGDHETPVECPVELTEANLWQRISQLEEDRETLSGRVDDLRDRLDAFEATALRMRVLVGQVPPGSSDVWHLRAVLAQLRDLLS